MITLTHGTKTTKLHYDDLVELLDGSGLAYWFSSDSLEVVGPTDTITIGVNYNG